MPPGTIILSSTEYTRFNVFQAHLMRVLRETPGASLSWNVGVDIAANLNDAIRRATGEWVWIIGDDHTFEGNIIERLWAHEVDVVVPLVLQRFAPHRMVLYHADETPLAVGATDRGLISVGLAGSAGMLIRRHVLDAVGDPWFTVAGVERQSEDIGFCKKVNHVGLRIYCDLDTHMGHLTTLEVWPTWDAQTGQWRVSYKQTNVSRLL